MLICQVPDCDKKAHCQGLCSKHYSRQVRTGSTEKVSRAKPIDLVHVGGNYLLTHAPEHPLRRGKANRVYAHRIAFYDAHGEGPFTCHHCGKPVDWSFMHVDHLDDDTQNNHLTNLVASCPVCNQKRGFHKSKAANRARGQNITYGGKTLPVMEWAEILGLSRSGLKTRMSNWPLEQVMLMAPGFKPLDQTHRVARLREALDAKAEKHTYDGRQLSARGWADLLGLSVKRVAYLIRTYGVEEGLRRAEALP